MQEPKTQLKPTHGGLCKPELRVRGRGRSAPAGPEQVEDDAEEDRGDEDGEALLGDVEEARLHERFVLRDQHLVWA